MKDVAKKHREKVKGLKKDIDHFASDRRFAETKRKDLNAKNGQVQLLEEEVRKMNLSKELHGNNIIS